MRRLFPENTFVAPAINAGNRLIVAEAPGLIESETGEPLTGPTGSWLRGRYDEERKGWFGGLLGRAGIRDVECSRLNVIQCRPPNNIFPTDPDAKSYISREEANESIHHCLNAHVFPVLSSRDWSRVDLLGEKALRYIAGKEEGISVWRGSPLPVKLGVDGAGLSDAPKAVPTFHPAWIARDQRFIPAVISDLKKSLIVPPEYYDTHPSLGDVRRFDATTFALDIETNPETGAVTMVGLCAEKFHAICVPFGGEYVKELKRIFERATELIGHNCLQFDLPILREHGIRLREDVMVWDTMLCQHLLQPDLPHDLGFLGSIFTNKPAWKHLSEADEELYCCRDVDVTFQCYLQLRPLLASQNLLALYKNVQVPLAMICRQMHEVGITIDPRRIGVVRERLLEEMKQYETILPESLRSHTIKVNKRVSAPSGTLSAKTGKPIRFLLESREQVETPWRSPNVIKAYLYDELKLPPQLHHKTQVISTDKVALEKLWRRTKRREIKAIQELRKRDELVTTFATEKMLNVQRLHPHFNVHGTRFGRLSSSEPNLQNIPPAARYIYVPSHPDWCFLEMDFSSLENRLSAWFARDDARLARMSDPSFNEHKYVASQFFNIPIAELTKDAPEYKLGKIINHGCDGGMGPKKIANMYDLDFGTVRDLVKKWRELNAKTVAHQESTAKLAKEQGYLVNPFGRKDWFYTDSYYTESNRFFAQSTGADICFRTMLGLSRDGLDRNGVVAVSRLLPQPWRLLIQVHDSLLFEGPRTLLDEVVCLIRSVAEQPWPELAGFWIPVEFKAGECGDSWGELKPYKFS